MTRDGSDNDGQHSPRWRKVMVKIVQLAHCRETVCIACGPQSPIGEMMSHSFRDGRLLRDHKHATLTGWTTVGCARGYPTAAVSRRSGRCALAVTRR